MLKKMQILLTGALLVCGLAACGTNTSGEIPTDQGVPTPQAASAETTPVPTAAPADTAPTAAATEATPVPTPAPTTAAQAAAEEQMAAEQAQSLTQQLASPAKGDQIAIMKTNMGDVTFKFFPQYAPKAVENFVTHAQEGYYDGVTFHRVIKDFMIQGGDPLGTGTGGESIWDEDFEIEITPMLHSINGSLCMANTGQPNSNGSQFYIVDNSSLDNFPGAQPGQLASAINTLKASLNAFTTQDGTSKVRDFYAEDVLDHYLTDGGAPSLDGGYTIFGQVIDGMDVVDQISNVATDDSDKPTTDVIINSIEVTTY